MAKKKKTSSARAAISAKKETRINQALAVFLLALFLFVFALAVYPGVKVWNTLHRFVLGSFGMLSFVVPLFVLTATGIYSAGRLKGLLKIRLFEIAGLLWLFSAGVDIFTTTGSETYSAHLKAVFLSASYGNGGVFGAFIGNGLFQLFGKTGAAIFVIILFLALLMLTTGVSVAKLFRGASRPVRAVSRRAEETIAEAREEKKKKYNVNIPVDDALPEQKPDEHLSEKERKVISAYHGFNDDEPVDLPKEPMSEEKKPAPAEPERIVMTSEETKKEIEHVEKEVAGGMKITEENAYHFPPLSLLKGPGASRGDSADDFEATGRRLVEVLHSFGVDTKVINISHGPTVTRYELQPCVGVKISKITSLADDIALNLAAAGVRIEAPIPNKAAVGIEVPNKRNSVVCMREILETPVFKNSKAPLTVALGKDIAGNPVITDVGKMPHGLIAGATGSGKSVCINSMIISLLYKASPKDVKLLLIDPKVVELGVYNGIPHLLVPVVTDPRKASGALGWAVTEMERRYRLFADNNVRDLTGFNRLCEMDTDLKKLPHIVIIIDELADLMLTAPREVEDSINRIAAKARAAGMHLLVATQRPSTDIVTGVIKANIPTRIAFSVSSSIDSRVILDLVGAEKLLGRGDMLFNPVGASKPSRVQGCFVSDEEVEAVVQYIKEDHSSDYDNDIQSEIERLAASDNKTKMGGEDEESGEEDPMLNEAIRVVVELGQASTSLLQRKLKLGYSRAARIIDQMEERGVIGPYEGSKPRQILLSKADLMEREASED